MINKKRIPSYPIITHDPYFSYWMNCDLPTAEDTRHWTGIEKFLRGNIIVDGIDCRFFGRGGKRAFKCVESDVTHLSTFYTYEDLGVRLKLKFTSPLLMDDLDIMSTPITYMDYEVESIDGKKHDVEMKFVVLTKNVVSGETIPKLRLDTFSDNGVHIGYLGQLQQKPLSASGDHHTIDWGYFFIASADSATIGNNALMSSAQLQYIIKFTVPFKSTLMLAYDDVASINYFGRMLPAYYARNGKTITQALVEFNERHDEIIERCAKLDQELSSASLKMGGKDYELITIAGYRQAIAGHKLVADLNGDLLFISKENDSNGCAATVDVSYPSVPLFLIYCPELVRAMCRPIFRFADMPIWHYDFAPHDVGRYPVLNGQIYGAFLRPQMHTEGATVAPYYLYPASVDAYDFKKQMPVEECANMLIMMAAAGRADKNYKLAKEKLETLRTWSKYLLEYGEDPGEQLCTDDFAGHLAHNVNLSAKAFMGIGAFAQILKALGNKEESEEYMKKAKAMGNSWLKRAFNGEYSYLTFEKQGWSQKYNLAWDSVLGLNIIPESFYRKETESYLSRLCEYGLPLDSRGPQTKSDWTVWSATMATDKAVFRKLIKPLAKFLRESPSRVPFSDFYDVESGYCERFLGRTVQGGVFMPLLKKKWSRKK